MSRKNSTASFEMEFFYDGDHIAKRDDDMLLLMEENSKLLNENNVLRSNIRNLEISLDGMREITKILKQQITMQKKEINDITDGLKAFNNMVNKYC